jgi:hypothetical protein
MTIGTALLGVAATGTLSWAAAATDTGAARRHDNRRRSRDHRDDHSDPDRHHLDLRHLLERGAPAR